MSYQVKRSGTAGVVIQGEISQLRGSMQGDQTEINNLYRLRADIQGIYFTPQPPAFSGQSPVVQVWSRGWVEFSGNQVAMLEREKQEIIALIDQRIQKERDEVTDKQKVIAFLQKVALLPT